MRTATAKKPAKRLRFQHRPQPRLSESARISPRFGQLLTMAREELGASRQDIAAACKVAYSTVWRHETGRATHLPRPDLFWALVFACDLTEQETALFYAAYGGGR